MLRHGSAWLERWLSGARGVTRSTSSRSDRARIALAVTAVSGSLYFPWFGLQLGPNIPAWSVQVALASVPLVGHLDYGIIELALLAAAVLSAWRSGWARGPAVRGWGALMVLMPLICVLTTRVAGGRLLFELARDGSESSFLSHYGAPGFAIAPSVSFFGFPSDPTTLMLLYSLRLGWYLSLAGGLVLAGALTWQRPSSVVIATGALVATLVACGLGLGWAAQEAKLSGLRAVADGQPARALHQLDEAVALSPQLAFETDVQEGVGQADLDLGRPTAAALLAEATESVGSTRSSVVQDISLLSRATSLAPRDQVIAAQYQQALAFDLMRHGVFVLGDARRYTGSVVVAWAIGLYLYKVGDFQGAAHYMRLASEDTSSSEAKSYADTYVALSEDRLGNIKAFRRYIVRAVGEDGLDHNATARDAAAGLFLSAGG